MGHRRGRLRDRDVAFINAVHKRGGCTYNGRDEKKKHIQKRESKT